ncbi:MAG: bifunctional folylpolyglutamate synthase/dihydrofolate synthase [Anaerolineales bacterium]|nr:bifunctional folylpolyglutamate synthase/dihydrofolate synthase [Anaerolineales bacterium]
MTINTYPDALEFLYSFVDYSTSRSYRYSPEVLDLGRVRDLLERLGNPHDSFCSVHVAGTKGKGSVSALISSSLKQAGHRTGLYTSPHLQRFTERIKIDGEEIAPAALIALVNAVRPAVEAIGGLTVYEIMTAMAFLHFNQEKTDCAVIEVGLGGRLDATNVITPEVSVITSLSYDHMHLLGNSLSDIAYEKGGIIKPGVPVVIAPQQHEAEHVLEKLAAERFAPLIRVGKEWHYAPGSHDLDGQIVHLWAASEQDQMNRYIETAGAEEWTPGRFQIPLLGYHQVINTAVAYAALQELIKQGMTVPEEAIRQGFKNVAWDGRFQILSRNPMLVVDCAHNRDSALKLRIALDDYFPGQPVTLIFGASADKDIKGMFTELLPRISRMVITQAAHPRAATPDDVARIAGGFALRTEQITPAGDALVRALKRAAPGEIILAAGSIFVVGEILERWKQIQPGAGDRK